MDERLPEGVDPALWFECAHTPGERDYLADEPWHTFPGRMQAWCPSRRVWFRVSKNELPADLPLATRYWAQGFLVGNAPRQPDAAEDSEAIIAWRASADIFLSTGQWTPDRGAEQLAQWALDAQVLAQIGEALAETPVPVIDVRLPRDLAGQALAAWRRDDVLGPEYETPAEREVRDHAATLALIGLAVEERGVADGDVVVVPLDADYLVAAVEAFRGRRAAAE